MLNNNYLYGVDLSQPITPQIARDALVECFYEAHCEDSGLVTDDPKIKREYILGIIKKSFIDVGGNFDEPTKEMVLNSMSKLQDFAKNFRDPSIVQKHASEMMKIVEKIN